MALHVHSSSRMESLSFLMFWKPTAILSSPAADVEEDEDSFFELEIELDHQLSLPDLNAKNIKCPTPRMKEREREKQSLSPSLTNLFSKHKVMPIETQPSSRPHSPISFFKSSPRFRVSMFRKSRSMPNPKTGEKTEGPDGCLIKAKSNLSGTGTRKAPLHQFAIDSDSDSSLLESSGSSISKRFSKEGVQRYLKLVKQFSAKGSDQSVDADELKIPSSNVPRRMSPLNLQSPVIPKSVKKSRLKATNGGGGVSSPARNDDTWAQHHEGIQGAILHCKQSFRSSRDCDVVSRKAAAVDTHSLLRKEHFSVPTNAS